MRILVVANLDKENAAQAAKELEGFCAAKAIDCVVIDVFDVPRPVELSGDEDAVAALERVGAIGKFDLVVTLGGDGTMLCAARIAIGYDAPILGINYGHLGFLANPAGEGVVSLVSAALEGGVSEDLRSNLFIEVTCADDDKFAPEERGPRHFFALNEVAITRGASPRILTTKVQVNGSSICTLRGDGLLVATPTGSTAYALSAGGPLMSPESSGMTIVPLATHTLQSRAIVTGADDEVEVTFPSDNVVDFAELELDGTTVSLERPIEKITVRRGSRQTRLLFHDKESFYDRIARVFFGEEN